MSLSPAYEDKSPEWEGRTVEIQDHVRFDRKRGRIETGDTPETLAKLLFPGKRSRIDTNSTDTISGAKSGQRVVAERHGALFACGPNKLEVFGLEAVQVEIKGLKPQRIAKGRHIIIKSDEPIEEVKVKALHPCLSEDGYTRVCQTTTWSKQPGTLTIPFRKFIMKLAEDDRGALCHCGGFFSRPGLVNHLQHIFGLPQGAMEYKAPRHTEQGVVFTNVTTYWGSCPRVWIFEKNNTWSNNLTFSERFEERLVFLSSGKPGLRITPNMVNAEPGKSVKLTVKVVQKTGEFQILANCILLTLLCTDSETNKRLPPMHGLRLPNLAHKSIEDPTTKQHPLFVGPPSAQVRPVLNIGRSFNVYKTDPLFEDLNGGKMSLSNQVWSFYNKLHHSVHRSHRCIPE